MRLVGRRSGSLQEENIIETIGVDKAGEWQHFSLKDTEKIVGVYGSLNSANNLRGLGFLVWQPLQNY
jgi:hypothetical protein